MVKCLAFQDIAVDFAAQQILDLSSSLTGSVCMVSYPTVAQYVPAFKPLRDPRLNARPCDLDLILTNPTMLSSAVFSMLRFAKASSPVNVSNHSPLHEDHIPKTLRAYKFALKNWQSPFNPASGVRHVIFVLFIN
jgi:hypothetical protein